MGVGLGVLMLGASPQASAQPADVVDAVEALRTETVYLHPRADRRLDLAAVTAAIGDAPIKIAVLPEGPSVAEVRSMPRLMSRDHPGNTIAVISGRYFYAGSEILCEGAAGRAATDAISRNEAALDLEPNSDLTKALVDFVTEVRASPTCAEPASRGDRYVDQPGAGQSLADGDSLDALPWVLGIGGSLGTVAIVGVLALRWRTRRITGAGRAATDRLMVRLATEIEQLPDTDDVGQVKSDALARHEEAGTVLRTAVTAEQFAAARTVVIEGLVATRSARIVLGRDIGDPIPDEHPATNEDRPTS